MDAGSPRSLCGCARVYGLHRISVKRGHKSRGCKYPVPLLEHARHGEWDKPDYFIGGGMILLEGYCGESLAGLCLPNLRESSGTSGGLGPGCKSSRFHIFLRPC